MSDLVNYVNNNNFTWKADLNKRFEGLTLSQLRTQSNRLTSSSKKNLA